MTDCSCYRALIIMVPMFSILAGLTACSSVRYARSDHFDGSRFFNPGAHPEKSFADVLKWKFTSSAKPWPEHVPGRRLPSDVARAVQSPPDKHVIQATTVNHASHLIQMGGFNIITDPVYSERVGPVSWAGPRRVTPSGVEFDALPKVDAVLVSHSHYDHLDLATLLRLWKRDRPVFLVPLGNAGLLTGEGIERVVELDWWQAHDLSPDMKVTLVPALHWSRRSMFDMNRRLWGGFVIESVGTKVYFAGDTGFGAHFSQIRERLGPMDLSILPIGAYEPRWFMKDSHMNPEDAVRAHLALESRLSVASHFGTFNLTDEGIDDPPVELARALDAAGIAPASFPAPRNGEMIRLEPATERRW